MKQLEDLIRRIIDRVTINLREPPFDVWSYVHDLVPMNQFARFYAFYGLTEHHPLHFHFGHCSVAGSYFLGKCDVDYSVLYKSDIRGDELKAKGDVVRHKGIEIPLHHDEVIRIKDSFLLKTLVHSNSHDPERPELFLIQNTVALHYANIHGSLMEGSFIGPFSTIDLTTVRGSAVGSYCYIQTGEMTHRRIENGRIWIRSGHTFNFNYHYHPEVLKRYIHIEPGLAPTGIFMEFVEGRKNAFQRAFDMVQPMPPVPVPDSASVSRYAVVKGNTSIGENVLVAQRAYLEDAYLGKGSNAQENCYIIKSRLEGHNITAHGGKIVHACLGEKVFVGFNSFLKGGEDCGLRIARGCIVMPHTIIDLDEPVEIPPGRLVWGYIRNRKDLDLHSMSLEELSSRQGEVLKSGR